MKAKLLVLAPRREMPNYPCCLMVGRPIEGLDMDVEDVDQDWLRVAILNRNNQRTRVLWDDSVCLNSTEDKRPRNVQGRAYCFR